MELENTFVNIQIYNNTIKMALFPFSQMLSENAALFWIVLSTFYRLIVFEKCIFVRFTIIIIPFYHVLLQIVF